MRVTNGMLANNMMRNINRNMTRMDKLQQNMATGKKFLKPSDDPIGVSRSLRLNTDIAVMEQYKRNVDDSISWLETTEMAMNNMIAVLQRTRELTVQAANDTNDIGERRAIAAEIDQLREQLIGIGNTTYAGRYIFSGYKTDKPLLRSDGTYDMGGGTLNTNEVISIDVGVGDRIGTSFVGQRIYGHMLEDADLDKGIGLGYYEHVLKAANTFAGGYNVAAPDNVLSFTYKSTTYSLNLTPGSYGDADALAAEVNNRISQEWPELKSSISMENEAGHLVFKAAGPFDLSLGSLANDLGYTTGNPVFVKHNLEGSAVDVGTKNINIVAGTGDKFTLTYKGIDYEINLDSPRTYDGTPGKTLDDLISDIQSKINGIGALQGHVTLLNAGGRIVVKSDAPVAVKNAASPSLDITTMGLTPNKQSIELGLQVKSGSNTQLIGVFDELIKDLHASNTNNISKALSRLDMALNTVNTVRAELGVKSNRLELTSNRIDDDRLNLFNLLSKNEDADMAEVIMRLKMDENVYKSSLSAGARIIQPTLIDFLR